MSDTTPTHVLQAVANNARGIGPGPTVTRAEWQKYATDLGGWFMWWGEMIDVSAKSIGGGMYQIKGVKRYAE